MIDTLFLSHSDISSLVEISQSPNNVSDKIKIAICCVRDFFLVNF